ncbi:uncharacterized protein LOC143695138 [Agelaius phoeniceus]|uniref:uncharacterized protein LOC143695138 n=1 Tax=Agelaius phoeniceus TaxID=39638 RepID=UPI004055315F
MFLYFSSSFRKGRDMAPAVLLCSAAQDSNHPGVPSSSSHTHCPSRGRAWPPPAACAPLRARPAPPAACAPLRAPSPAAAGGCPARRLRSAAPALPGTLGLVVRRPQRPPRAPAPAQATAPARAAAAAAAAAPAAAALPPPARPRCLPLPHSALPASVRPKPAGEVPPNPHSPCRLWLGTMQPEPPVTRVPHDTRLRCALGALPAAATALPQHSPARYPVSSGHTCRQLIPKNAVCSLSTPAAN